ncbi:hypothetical protein BH10PSE7_BH10PSE7_43460 [soil metagenome]
MAGKILVYTLHKCASTFLHRFCQELCDETRLRLVSVNDPAFCPAIRNGGYYANFFDHGDVFAPIRVFEPPPGGARSIIQLRDPRDLLVSNYFSLCYSHGTLIPGAERLMMARYPVDPARRINWQEQGVDSFVLECAPLYAGRFEEYLSFASARDIPIVRYEDMVLDFDEWAETFLEAIGYLKYAPVLIERLRSEIAIPLVEDKTMHKRRVTPGDHAVKLMPATIASLNHTFNDVLERLDYPRSIASTVPGVTRAAGRVQSSEPA